jgi:hypothetical protein
MSDVQIESSGDVLKDIGPGPSGKSCEGKERVEIGDGRNGNGHNGDKRDGDQANTDAIRDTGAIGVRDSSKRPADNAGLNEGAESVPRPEKVRRRDQSVVLSRYVSRLIIPTDPIEERNDIDHNQSVARIHLPPKPGFEPSSSQQDLQPCENKISPNRSSKTGDSHSEPPMSF